MKLAIISDLHANLDAVNAVLDDIDRVGADEIICLGDVVGYGPCPLEVIDLVIERCSITVKGNHDEALVHGAYGFHAAALKAIDWTRDQMKPGFFSGPAVRRRWDFLANLPLRHERGPDVFVHGSPRDPTQEYVLAQELAFGPTGKYEEIFAAFDRLLFVGHTHLPCVIDDEYQARTASGVENAWTWTKGRAIVNVGSVGQPRDRDPRACYATFDGERVEWRRVAYDIERAAKRFAEVSELEPRLASRLAKGE